MNILKNKKFLVFVGKFLLVFCCLYFGTLAVIGLAAPGGMHSLFVQHYLDYVSWLKMSLLHASGFLLSLFSIRTEILPGFILQVLHGKAILIAMDCVGYGVYSFWIAYVVANDMTLKKKIGWGIGGLLMLWSINVIRISLVLIAFNKGWPMPLGIDHHTWFNIVAYLAIFAMMWRFEKATKQTTDNRRPTTITH